MSSSVKVKFGASITSAKNVTKQYLPTPISSLKPKEKIRRLGYIHAFGMLSVLFVFLATIYTSQEPYRFMSSNLALQRTLLISDLNANESLDAEQIWRWLEKVISHIGGHTIDKIEANCAYSEFKEQIVEIDGSDYILLDPTQRTASCPADNMKHINGADKATYLAGSHQLLSFGVFTKRSIPHEPIKGSINEGSHLHEIPSDDIHAIDPAHDHKVSELCHVDVKPQSGDFNDTVCVLIDGFKGKIGTSMNWPGLVLPSTWDDQTYYAFDSGSEAILFRDHHYQAVFPCYSHRNYTDSTGEEALELISGIPHYTGDVADMVTTHCTHAWITSGEDIRTTCTNQLAKEPTPREAYVAAKGGHTDRNAFFEYYFGCEHVMNATHHELDHIFIESEQPLESHLTSDGSNGVFFHSENQKTWIESSLLGQELLELNEFIDAHTRVFKVFLITRDLAADSLFYSLLRVEFLLKADGTVEFEYHSIFVPIMHYTYGLDGYERLFSDVLIWECMFAILFVFFVYRELSQLICDRIIPRIKSFKTPSDSKIDTNSVRVSPKKVTDIFDDENAMDDGDNGVDYVTSFHTEIDNTHGKNFDVENNDQCNDTTKSTTDSSNKDNDTAIDYVVNNKTKAKVNATEARNLRRERTLVSRMKSIGASFKGVAGFDLNNNGIDDVDEIKEILEDFLLPDAKGIGDLLDWATILIVTVAMVYRIKYVNLCLVVHDLFLQLNDGENYNHFMEDIVNDFEEVDSIVVNIRILSLFIVIIGLVQFFRYLSFDRRFAIVTDTIMSASVDLIPVLAIFGVVCVAYAVMGTAIYGQDLIEFADIGSSLSSLFLMILGQFDGYYAMVGVAKPITIIFFWSFVIIAYFILFNMVLAVIFTVYDQEYDELKAEMKLEEAAAKRIIAKNELMEKKGDQKTS